MGKTKEVRMTVRGVPIQLHNIIKKMSAKTGRSMAREMVDLALSGLARRRTPEVKRVLMEINQEREKSGEDAV